MEPFRTAPSAAFAAAAYVTVQHEPERETATYPRMRRGRESASGEGEARLAQAWRSDARYYRGAIESPLFADV